MNRCGDCKECCVTFKIDELDKPKNTPCKHLGCNGCEIYNKRPGTCKKFECMYFASDWSEELRPDKSGVIIARYPEGFKALRIKDNVNPKIMDKITEVSKEKNIEIIGIDARKKSEGIN